MRKVEPLGKALRGYSAWVTGIRRVEAPTRANAPLISWDKAFGLVKINPLAAWTDEEMQAYIDANDVLVNPLVFEGYPSIGCAPCTAKPDRGRGSAQRPLGWSVEDGMRFARLVTKFVPARHPVLVLTAHGSADPRSAASAHEVAQHHPDAATRCRRPGGVLRAELPQPPRRVRRDWRDDAVVVPLLLADAYHARVDIPAMIARVGADCACRPTSSARTTGSLRCCDNG